MIEIVGKYNRAIVYADFIEDEAVKQIKDVCNLYIFRDSKIRIMPDCHSGKGCVIGFTADMIDVVVPNLIGADIGCGMLTVILDKMDIDFAQLDNFIRQNIPSSFEINKTMKIELQKDFEIEIDRIAKLTRSDATRHKLALGTLGGGNHFIEINENNLGKKYLVVHTGSRNFGHQIAEYYQKKAVQHCEKIKKSIKAEREQEIKKIRKTKNKLAQKQIDDRYEALLEPYHVPNHLAFLEGDDCTAYLNDMKIAQQFASLNRKLIAGAIIKFLGAEIGELEHFETIHNYIHFEDKIIRKGAVSAHNGEIMVIPINMRDGSILAKGKGNIEYNYSAPHGAGRLLSRKRAFEKLSIEEYERSMSEVYSSSISQRTLDESPMAYKSIDMIMKNIEDSVEILDIIKPIYNYKAE